MLVVDDEAAIRDSLRMILEYEGYRVEEAAGGSQALAKVAERLPDAVVLDIKMPEMDGLELLARLPRARLRHAGADDQRPRRRADRGRGHPPRRLRLLREAAAARARAASRCATPSRRYRLQRREPVLRPEPEELIGSRAGDAPPARDDREGGADARRRC